MTHHLTPHDWIQNLDDILNLSREILVMASDEKKLDLPVLSQLLMRRGNLIAQMSRNSMETVFENNNAAQTQFKETLNQINTLEPDVQIALTALREKIGKKLDATIQDKQAVHLYHLSSPEEIRSTRTDRA